MKWLSIAASALITGIVTLGLGWIYSIIQAKQPELLYRSSVSKPFVQGTATTFIQQIDVINTGDTSLEDVSFNVKIPKTKIIKHQIIAKPNLTYVNYRITHDSAAFVVPTLHTGESIKLALMLSSNVEYEFNPDIHLRSKNVLGNPEKISNPKESLRWLSLIMAYVGAITAALSFLVLRGGLRNFFRNLF